MVSIRNLSGDAALSWRKVMPAELVTSTNLTESAPAPACTWRAATNAPRDPKPLSRSRREMPKAEFTRKDDEGGGIGKTRSLPQEASGAEGRHERRKAPDVSWRFRFEGR